MHLYMYIVHEYICSHINDFLTKVRILINKEKNVSIKYVRLFTLVKACTKKCTVFNCSMVRICHMMGYLMNAVIMWIIILATYIILWALSLFLSLQILVASFLLSWSLYTCAMYLLWWIWMDKECIKNKFKTF